MFGNGVLDLVLPCSTSKITGFIYRLVGLAAALGMRQYQVWPTILARLHTSLSTSRIHVFHAIHGVF